MSDAERRRRIIVVDDDRMVLRIVERQLDCLGWEAYPAGTAAEALSILRSLGPVEALLTDVNMPVMDGVSLLREVRQTFPDTAVLFMSGTHDRVEIPVPGVSSAFVLHKPFTLRTLAATLERACRGGD